MLRRTTSGTWMPSWVPGSTIVLSTLLIFCSAVQSTTGGYDGSMMNGLNILPSYTEYFELDDTTTGLQTAAVFIGGAIGPLFAGVLSDWAGRRPAIFWSSAVTIVGIILQTAAQNIAMFVIARIILGFGSTISGVAAGVYLSETFPSRYRAWGVGTLNNFYYVGALIAAGVTLGTGEWESTWAWRCPSLIQGIFSVLCILILPFIPESPRWLLHQGFYEDARLVVAQTNSDGNILDPVAVTVYKEILDTLEWEKKEGRTMKPVEIVKTPVARRRLLIGTSCQVLSACMGNVIASYYLGPELETAGIKDPVDQLKANVVLNVWCLACAFVGTHFLGRWGRKPTALVSTGLLTVSLFIIGGLSKMYADDPLNASQSLIYGDVAVMFLFQGFYSIAWTPLLYLYPPEVMNYSIRANGLAFSAFWFNAVAVLMTEVMPIGIARLGWKMYIINGSWDILFIAVVAFFWVETKGKTLEEVDAIFEGQKHSSVPDVEDVRLGRGTIDVKAMTNELEGVKGEETFA